MDNHYEKLIGRVIDKRYKIENVVGVGGMAYVLRATDTTTGRDVAVKILSDEYHNDERAVKRFINESKTVSLLDHENIVKILDVVITEDLKYIVMEFIDGITLKDYIDKIGRLSWKEAVYYIKQILRALSHAHEKTVIHRDIKPQNIMLLSDGTVKVTDFGIAKQAGAESITMTDKAIGTVNYISPEQASGAAVDSRTDIYSTGVMLYEMVTGRLPFIADSPVAVAMMQVSNEPVAPREINAQIPTGLEQIILKAMQKSPDDRFTGAAAMLKALDYFTENPDVVFAGSAERASSTGKAKKNTYESEEKKLARLKKRVRGSRSMFPIIAGVAASFAVVGIVFVIAYILPRFKGTTDNRGDMSAMEAFESGFATAVDRFLGVEGNADKNQIAVPSFVGKKYDDTLLGEMQSAGFTAESVSYVRDASFGAGLVVRQEPEADAIRLKPENGRKIPVALYVNMGEEEFAMPNLALMFVTDAKKILRAEVAKSAIGELSAEAITVVEEFHDTYPADYVIRTEPAADDTVSLDGELRFTLYVSKGQKISTTTVPELEGILIDQAKKRILNAKLALGKVYYEESDTVEAGVVIKSSHKKGEVAAQSITAVDLWVSIGSKNPVVLPQSPQETETPEPALTESPATSGENTPDEHGTPVSDIAGLLDMRG